MQKLLTPNVRSVVEVSLETGIAQSTLYRWKNEYQGRAGVETAAILVLKKSEGTLGATRPPDTLGAASAGDDLDSGSGRGWRTPTQGL